MKNIIKIVFCCLITTLNAEAVISAKNHTDLHEGQIAINEQIFNDSIKFGHKKETIEDIKGNDKNKSESLDFSILDSYMGNKFSQQSRLFDLRLDNQTYGMLPNGLSQIRPIYAELSMDMFAGLLMGNFPYYSPEVYRANVQDLKLQASLNLTTNFKLQILNLAKFDLEVDIVPLQLGVGLSAYTTSLLEDNCIWVYFESVILTLTTRLKKNFARCGFNLRNDLKDMDSFDELFKIGANLFLKDIYECEFDDVLGDNTQKLDFLSISLDDFLRDTGLLFNYKRVQPMGCANKFPDFSVLRTFDDEPYETQERNW